MAKSKKAAAPAGGVATMSMDDLFKEAAKVAAPAPKTSKKKEPPLVYIDGKGVELPKKVGDMIRLVVVGDILKKVTDSTKAEALDLLFRLWIDDVWDKRTVGDNPRVAIRKPNTSVIDMSVVFQVKHRSDGIKLPDELPAGRTAQDHIIFELTSPVVGLSAVNAAKLVQDGGEIVVKQEYFVADFKSLVASDDAEIRSGAEKIFRLIMGAAVDPLTPGEKAKILQTRQIVRVKEGFIDRSFTYCETKEQLYKLLNYVKVGKTPSDPQFAEGDKKSDRDTRLEETVREFLTAAAD